MANSLAEATASFQNSFVVWQWNHDTCFHNNPIKQKLASSTNQITVTEVLEMECSIWQLDEW